MFRRLVVAFAAVVLSSVSLQAQITVYNTNLAFLGAVGPVTIEDFTSDYHFDLGSTLNSLSAYTPGSGTPIAPGDIKAGVTYSVSGGPLVIDAGGNFTGGFLDGLYNRNTVGPLTATFAGPVSGFGFLTNQLMGTFFDITINYVGGSYTNQIALSTGNQFFGFVSGAQNITSVVIGGDSQVFNFALDDFTFSAVEY
ncbi:MAG: hypothetical protein IPP90_06080, partial [Gemmatimonadaceae bacterium]|nr:hypothetical protein [Gemmatimonadaceae bacterium]